MVRWLVAQDMGTVKDSMTMKLRMRKRTSSLGVRLIGMAMLVLVRVLVRPVWEVCMDGMWIGEFGKNLKGTGESNVFKY